jgi:hypothetical protein
MTTVTEYNKVFCPIRLIVTQQAEKPKCDNMVHMMRFTQDRTFMTNLAGVVISLKDFPPLCIPTGAVCSMAPAYYSLINARTGLGTKYTSVAARDEYLSTNRASNWFNGCSRSVVTLARTKAPSRGQSHSERTTADFTRPLGSRILAGVVKTLPRAKPDEVLWKGFVAVFANLIHDSSVRIAVGIAQGTERLRKTASLGATLVPRVNYTPFTPRWQIT